MKGEETGHETKEFSRQEQGGAGSKNDTKGYRRGAGGGRPGSREKRTVAQVEEPFLSKGRKKNGGGPAQALLRQN